MASHYSLVLASLLVAVLFSFVSFVESKETAAEPGDSKRDILTRLKPLWTPKPSPVARASQPIVNKQDAILQFTKRIYKDLGNNMGNVTRTTDKFKEEYDDLENVTDGRLGPALSSLLEMRMLDLQASIRHARRMHQVVVGFIGKDAEGVSI